MNAATVWVIRMADEYHRTIRYVKQTAAGVELVIEPEDADRYVWRRSADEVRKMLPANLRGCTQVVEVQK